MKKYKVLVQPIAESDLQSIDDYISVALCNPDAAIKLIDEFSEQFERISQFPHSGKAVQWNLPLDYEYYQAIVHNYMIFYTVDDTNETVTIMRVIYGGSDYIAKLM